MHLHNGYIQMQRILQMIAFSFNQIFQSKDFAVVVAQLLRHSLDDILRSLISVN